MGVVYFGLNIYGFCIWLLSDASLKVLMGSGLGFGLVAGLFGYGCWFCVDCIKIGCGGVNCQELV